MQDDDPFKSVGDVGATVIRPMPGGRRGAGAPARPAPPPSPMGGGAPAWTGELVGGTGLNPLVDCATPLLTLAGELRGAPSHADPAGLRDRLIRQVREFETNARANGLPDSVVLPARYVLCALLDESVLTTPWGSESVWSEQGLLISFHNEAWGGEKFFTALDRLLAYPSGNLQMLELMYLCLSLGFEGRYQLREGGREALEGIRERLFQTIRNLRGDPEHDLSPRWRGVEQRRDPLIHHLPLWVFSAVAAIALLGLFAFFTFALNQQSDPVYFALGRIDQGLMILDNRPPPPVVKREPPPPPPPPPAQTPPEPPPLTLKTLLADDIAAGKVEVEQGPKGETVTIRGDALFPSARADVNDAYRPLLKRIGEALGKLPGQVLVTGHTDSVPIKTLRFPSNWHLSKERAANIASLLAEVTGTPTRFTAEGRADTEPLITENPRDPRNRRVEITLMQAHKAPPAAGPSEHS